MIDRIGLFGPESAAVIAALHDEAHGPGWSAAEWAAVLEGGVAFAHIGAEPGSEAPTGFIVTRVAGDEAEILMLCVRPHARRAGRGRTLLAAAAVEARRRGAAALFLEVAVSNDAALGLYRTYGFAVVGRRRGYYDSGEDAAVMRLALADWTSAETAA